eukprot:3146685-Rhodomonas_salina.6
MQIATNSRFDKDDYPCKGVRVLDDVAMSGLALRLSSSTLCTCCDMSGTGIEPELSHPPKMIS